MKVLKSLLGVLSKLIDGLWFRSGRPGSTSSSTMPDFPEMKPERTQIWPESPEDDRGEELSEPSTGSVGVTITFSIDIRP